MALNKLTTGESNNQTFKKRPLLEAGPYEGRVLGLVELGKRANTYEPEKPARNMIRIMFEIPDQTYETTNEKGEAVQSTYVFKRDVTASTHEKAFLTKLIKSTNPGMDVKKGFKVTDVVGQPVALVIEKSSFNNQQGETIEYNKAADISPINKKLLPLEESNRETMVFDFDEPCAETFAKMPEFLKEELKKALNYPGSAVQKLENGTSDPITNDTDAVC